MGLWSAIKHAMNSTLGTQNFKPLDVIFDEKTKVKIQQVNFSFNSDSSQSGVDQHKIVGIDSINVSKSIVIPASITGDPGVSSIYFDLSSNSVTCNLNKNVGQSLSGVFVSAYVITFAN